jgi:hypothetical protein
VGNGGGFHIVAHFLHGTCLQAFIDVLCKTLGMERRGLLLQWREVLQDFYSRKRRART